MILQIDTEERIALGLTFTQYAYLQFMKANPLANPAQVSRALEIAYSNSYRIYKQLMKSGLI